MYDLSIDPLHTILGSEDITSVYRQIRAAKAQGKWKQIGLGLGLSPATLKGIREEHSGDNPRLYSTLNTWVNEKKLQTTWRILVNTLRSEDVNESTLADRLLAEKGNSEVGLGEVNNEDVVH